MSKSRHGSVFATALLLLSCGAPLPDRTDAPSAVATAPPSATPVAASAATVSQAAEASLAPYETPPDVAISGVQGALASWCGRRGCADAVPSALNQLPANSEPLVVSLPAGSRLEGAAAYSASGDLARELEVEDTRLGAIPEGAGSISIFLMWADGSGAYYWAISRDE